jgi:endoglucanase
VEKELIRLCVCTQCDEGKGAFTILKKAIKTVVLLAITALVLTMIHVSVFGAAAVKKEPTVTDEKRLLHDANWSLENGELRTNVLTQKSALWDTPVQTNLMVETVINLEGTSAGATDYKYAGVIARKSSGNTWYLLLGEKPDGTHYVEMKESLNGVDFAQYSTSLVGTPLSSTTTCVWEYNHPYKLRLEVTEESVTGAVYEMDGTLLWEYAYVLYGQENSVKEGVPGLLSAGMKAKFKDYKIGATEGIKFSNGVPSSGLNRGMNIGDPISTLLWDEVSFEAYMRLFKAAGFDHVRIPFKPGNLFTLKGAGALKAERYDYAVQTVIDNGMIAIFDLHEYPGYQERTKLNEELFISFWREAAERYKDYPDDQLYFELANEVWDTGASAAELREIVKNTIAVIRETNPTRKIIVPAPHTNNIEWIFATGLPEDDRNLIVAIHFYDPFEFTFQKDDGGEWVEWKGTDAEKRAITKHFETAAAWATAKGVPVVVGEFGAAKVIPSPDKELWTAFVRETAERLNLSWTLWDLRGLFEFPGGFLYDMGMLKALIPETAGMTGLGFTTEEPNSPTEPENKDIVEPTESEIDDESGDSDGLTDSAFGDESDAEETFSDDGDVPKGEMPKTEEGLAIPLWVWLGSGALLLLAIGRKIAVRWRTK